MSKFDQVLGQGSKDEFANFQFEQPKPVGRFRPFIRRSRFKALAKGLRSTNDGISSLSGSTQNLLDQSKLMNLQEDAKARRISSEIMKHRLYESVISTSPRRRRMSASVHNYGADEDPTDYRAASYYMYPAARMAMSMPATPATSQRTTPAHSPTQSRKFMFGFFSRGGTPGIGNTPEDDLMDIDMDETVEDNSCRGIASIFKPQPKYIPGAQWTPRVEQDEFMMCTNDTPSQQVLNLQDVPKKAKSNRNRSSPSSSDGED